MSDTTKSIYDATERATLSLAAREAKKTKTSDLFKARLEIISQLAALFGDASSVTAGELLRIYEPGYRTPAGNKIKITRELHELRALIRNLPPETCLIRLQPSPFDESETSIYYQDVR